MINFAMAAEASEMDPDEDVVEVPIGDKVYYARRPTVAQTAYLENATRTRNLGVVFKMLHSLIGGEATRILEDAILDRRIDFGDILGGGTKLNPDKGLIDQIFEEFKLQHPTKPSSDSAESPRDTGRKSTRRSPGKGSTRSASTSTDSSTGSTSSPSDD